MKPDPCNSQLPRDSFEIMQHNATRSSSPNLSSETSHCVGTRTETIMQKTWSVRVALLARLLHSSYVELSPVKAERKELDSAIESTVTFCTMTVQQSAHIGSREERITCSAPADVWNCTEARAVLTCPEGSGNCNMLNPDVDKSGNFDWNL